jgi:hypothetical protein
MSTNTVSQCQTLVDVLLRCDVCRSEEDARLAILPALISCGILYHWPDGYEPPNHEPEKTPKWGATEVWLNWPPRRTLAATEVAVPSGVGRAAKNLRKADSGSGKAGSGHFLS